MTNKQILWENTDLRVLIERDLGKPKLRTSQYAQWPCPLHGESKGCSFTVWTNGWTCFGKCQRNGDVIAWLTEYHHMSRDEAWIYLGLSEEEAKKRFIPPYRYYHPPVLSIAEPPSPEWQSAGLHIVEEAERNLWGWKGERALDWLHGRGLIDPILRDARIGFWHGRYTEWDHSCGLNIPCGILIPWFADGQLWGIKVRRAAGIPKYVQVGTSKRAEERMGKPNLQGSLYWADNLLPGWAALVTEGEFDCLIAWQEARDLVCPVTVGSASYPLNPRWYAALAGCNPILACTDTDQAGGKAAERLLTLGGRARRIVPPSGKDVNEFYQLARGRSVYTWLETIISSSSEKAVAA